MRNVRWLAAASLVVLTAGCVEQGGYPTTYGYGSPGYGYSNGYYSQPTYYSQPAYRPAYYTAPATRVVTQTRYVAVPVSQPTYHRRMRDSDRDGIPDRYDRDRNGDGVPDRYQRRQW